MAILGQYTGDKNKESSYLWGSHWKNSIGYRIVKGADNFNHYFGDLKWNIPLCKLCNEPLHQVLTLDLNDPRLRELRVDNLNELPLVSCLNCSTSWDTQLYKLNNDNKSIEILFQNDIENYINADDDKIPSPLPRTNMKLEEFLKEDIPVDEDSYYNAFDYLGSEYIGRVVGAPLYTQNPVNRECPNCKTEMLYVATIASADYDFEGTLVDNVDFFLGEMMLYFLFCKECMCIKVECQGT